MIGCAVAPSARSHMTYWFRGGVPVCQLMMALVVV